MAKPVHGPNEAAMESTKLEKEQEQLPQYSPPKGWLPSSIPASFIPYCELMRLFRPVGVLNIYFPYFYGAVYAAVMSAPLPDLSRVLITVSLLFLSGFLLRSLGCSWNDIVDRDLDRKVARCRLRPMARGAISVRNAYLFTLAQTILWLCTLSIVSRECVLYSIPLIFMVAFYPFAKRITNFAQAVLGVTLSWGVLIGSVAMGVDPLQLVLSADTRYTAGAGMMLLCLIYIFWTITHDIIYACQDLIDDIKAGIKSMAVRFQHHIKPILWALAVLQLGLFLELGQIMGASFIYYLLAFGGNLALLAVMILRLNLDDPGTCLWWFQTGSLIFGTTTAAGLFGEYLNRVRLF